MSITIKELKEKLENTSWLNDEIDLQSIDCTYNKYDNEEIEIDDFIEQASDYINQSVEIIYYSNAIKFLQENDPSLRDSLEIANDFGASLNNINSEFLATILLQSYCLEELTTMKE